MTHTTTLVIARHGNTFAKGQTPTRVGGRTDLELVEEKRSRAIGRYLKNNDLTPAYVFAAPLKRTMQTAQLAIDEAGFNLPIQADSSFTEIDYGPDENKTEDEVMLRLGSLSALEIGQNPDNFSNEHIIAIGKEVLNAWNEDASVPTGWKVDPQAIIANWHNFAKQCENTRTGQTTLLVTSNGIARFSPYLTGDFAAFAKENEIKIATGGVCIFKKSHADENWSCTGWNIRPFKLYNDL